ncbi:MAG: excinuclease ABC subunit UvrA, partial [Selenomonas sp.]|nr:excinuclease ABC subunit UvrA [Selenomonas sp.]
MDNKEHPKNIIVRGARVHNLKNIDVDIPLGKLVAIAGVSGSGKSSLALGTLYAEGSRRYLEALSTYTRRRITQAGKADVEEIRHVPAALALHQRPGIPGVRSTFGTASELLNSLRLLFSRLGSHTCPHGHLCPPNMDVALMLPTKCPVCGEEFYGPGAEAMAFNSEGACPHCSGTGVVRTVDEASLVPDESLSIAEGAVAPWQTLMWSLMKDIAKEMGVRIDVPFCDLTPEEKEIVFHGPAEKKHILYVNEKTNVAAEMDFTYYNAVYTVENALAKVKDEKGMKRVEKFLHEAACPECQGTRLSAKVRSTKLAGKNLAEATAMTLDELIPWVRAVPNTLPQEMRPMAESIIESFLDNARRLKELGLGYLSLDRASSTLSTGERQRVQLARAVRNETTGVLYVLDEPSIGLHPANIEGLLDVIDSLLRDGNSVVLVDHDVHVLQHADYMIELGPLAGSEGGNLLFAGDMQAAAKSKVSKIAPFMRGGANGSLRERAPWEEMFALGTIHLETNPLHT